MDKAKRATGNIQSRGPLLCLDGPDAVLLSSWKETRPPPESERLVRSSVGNVP